MNKQYVEIYMHLLYRQNYRPDRAMRLPRWALQIWRWL